MDVGKYKYYFINTKYYEHVVYVYILTTCTCIIKEECNVSPTPFCLRTLLSLLVLHCEDVAVTLPLTLHVRTSTLHSLPLYPWVVAQADVESRTVILLLLHTPSYNEYTPAGVSSTVAVSSDVLLWLVATLHSSSLLEVGRLRSSPSH